MPNIAELQLDLSHSGLLLFIGILAAIAFSLFIYRFTNPPVSKALRILLSVIRSLVLVILLFVLFQAVITITHSQKIEPTVAIAVDESSSMGLEDKNGSRIKQLQTVLSAPALADLAQKFNLSFYRFSSTTTPIQQTDLDSMQFWGDETNIHQAIQHITKENQQKNLQGILLLTDGNYNAGENPLRFSSFQSIPIHSVVIGSPESIPDIEIVQLQTNTTAFVNQATQVQATVRAIGMSNTTLPVHLYLDDKKVATRNVEIKSSPSEQKVDFTLTPQEAGQKKISVRVATLENELATDNNNATEYIDILKSKIKILIIAGHPTFDVAYFKRNLNQKKYEITTLVQKSPSTFYNNADAIAILNTFDIFLLLDFPTQATSQTFMQNLSKVIEQNAKPIFLSTGNQFDIEKISALEYLPLTNAETTSERVLPVLSGLGATHPILQNLGNDVNTQTIWKQVAPLPTFLKNIKLQPGTQTLLHAKSEHRTTAQEPLLCIRQDKQKTVAIFAQDLWRWELMMGRFAKQNTFFNTLVQNIFKWLETDINNKLVQVKIEKTTFNFGEPVRVQIRVIDENMNSLSDADVVIEISKNGKSETMKAKALGEGKFLLELQPQTPGEFTAIVEVDNKGRHIGRKVIRFSVGAYAKERSDLQAAQGILQAMAEQTNGLCLRPDSLAPLSQLEGKLFIKNTVQEKEMWNNRFLLLFVILLLCCEWFIRKRTGML